MEKKRLFVTLGAMVVTGAIAVTTTLALLNNVTETKKNTFNSSNDITTELTEEEFWEKGWTDYWPGEAKVKTPKLVNKENSDGPIYAAMRVTFIGNDGNKLSYEDFSKYASIQIPDYDENGVQRKDDKGNLLYKNQFNIGTEEGTWRMLSGSENDENGILFIYNSTVEPNNETEALFTQVKVNAGITGSLNESGKTKNVYKVTKKADGSEEKTLVSSTDTLLSQDETYVDENGKVLDGKEIISLPTFEIRVKGFAVQAQGVELNDAEEELISLSNLHPED